MHSLAGEVDQRRAYGIFVYPWGIVPVFVSDFMKELRFWSIVASNDILSRRRYQYSLSIDS